MRKNISKICLIVILIAMLLSFHVSCGELDFWFYSDCIHGCWRDTGQTEPTQQAEDKKDEVQRPGEHQEVEKEAEKDVDLGMDQGQVSPSGGSASGGGHP